MKFEEILPALREGKRIRRTGWRNQGYIRKITIGIFELIADENNNTYVLTINDLCANDWEVIKEKKKIKLRDLTEEQYKKWFKNNCDTFDDCDGCPFSKVRCINYDKRKNWWIDNKDSYSDKFLNQSIEIED